MLDDHCSGLEKGYSNFAADESIKEIMKNEKTTRRKTEASVTEYAPLAAPS